MATADDWDLHAVVKGCCFPELQPAAVISSGEDPFSSFPPVLMEDEYLFGEEELLVTFPDFISTHTTLHDLEELCKPFFLSPPPQQTLPLPPPPPPPPALQQKQLQPVAERRQAQQPKQPTRSKRRKNQQKRVVCQVPAEGNPADVWAWRKYGQKPIKGSPYPRGYYRCSSSKGCLARKQVERSQTDPGMLVITYTAEHNHPAPTHRNSLAGTTRNKFPPPAHPAASWDTKALSPTTRLKPPTEEEDEEEKAFGIEGMAGEDMLFMGFEFDGDSGFPENFEAPSWLATGDGAAEGGGG